jgi:hypothetical protein
MTATRTAAEQLALALQRTLAVAGAALARVALPFTALGLGPETRDPWHRPPAQLERLNRYEREHGLPLTGPVARRPEPAPAGPRRPHLEPALLARHAAALRSQAHG